MTKEERAALGTVKNFLKYYSERSVDGCMSLFSSFRPIMLFGTNADEVFKTLGAVRSALKRDFKGMTDIRWGKHRMLHVETASTLASVLVELPISYQAGGKKASTIFRYALTLTLEDGKWKICSGMASVPFSSGTYSFSE